MAQVAAEQKKKILYVITKSNWGGAQRYIYDLATSVPRDRYEPVVACGGNGELCERLCRADVRVISIPSLERDIRIFNEIRVFRALLNLYESERPDIVHLNSSKIGGLGALAARMYNLSTKNYKLKTKIIFTAHGWAHEEDRPWMNRQLILLASWITALCAHQTIVISESGRSAAPRLFLGPKTSLIRNGAEHCTISEREAARRALAEKVSANEDVLQKTWVGTVSELHVNKGLVYTIKALREVVKSGHDAIFFVIGDGEERENLEQCVKENRMQKCVYFAGHIADAPALLSAFDIFTLTSLKEGLPYTILEAGHAALPVVASRVGGIPDIIDDMRSGLLTTPKDEKSIAAALQYLLQHTEKRTALGAALQQKTAQHFTKNRMITQTCELY